ncbi:hypothetical protein VTK73DRAFT_514 [Phialemonium thermophilum]|uniref:UBC core domain-containing protein n=1 Tax=Phialemonium thermophilum TaxID=223376 RepID=A0ABR3Y3V2_9PEZI
MATSQFNSKSPTIRRIMREAAELAASPSPDYAAQPLETDLFEWHFTLRGPPNSPYADGIYHGRIVLPPSYPLRPPSFRFVTPSGRFEVNREICLSISGHHEETWQPAWGLRTALVALRAFMETDSAGQVGGLDTPDQVRRRLAAESRAFRCSACGARSNEEILTECAEAARAAAAATGSSASVCGAASDVQVPVELRMAFRDELENKDWTAEAAAAKTISSRSASGEHVPVSTEPEMNEESAELAEGFVQTVPEEETSHAAHWNSGAGDLASLPARPAQGPPQPTRTVPQPAPVPQSLTEQRRARNDYVTLWIDRLIVILGVLLAFMVWKVVSGW